MTNFDQMNAGRPGGSLFPSLPEIISALHKRALMIVGLTLLAAVAAIAVAFLIPPQFESTASVFIDQREKKIVDFEAVLSDIVPDTPTLESEVEIIRSTGVLGRVATDLNLYADPEFLRDQSPVRRLLELVGLASDKNQARRLEGESADVLEEAQRQSLALQEAIDTLADNISVARLRNTYIIEITYRSSSAAKAAAIANGIADAYLNDQVDSKLRATEAATEWLDKRVGDLKERVHRSERKVEEYKAANRLIDSEGHLLGEKELARQQEQYVLAQAETATARARYRQLEEMAGRNEDAGTLADVLQNATVSRLKERYADTTRQLAELTTRYGSLHPLIAKAKAESADVKSQLEREIDRIVANLKNEYEVAAVREAAIGTALDKLKQDSGTTSRAVVTLKELEREATAARNVYEGFLKRFEETAQQNLQLPDARIIEIAQPAEFPASPKRRQIAIGGTLAGFVAALALALLLEIANPTTIRPERIEASLALPHLSTVPIIAGRPARDSGLAVADVRHIMERPQSQFSEAIRTLRIGIDARAEPEAKVILLVSALPNDGKTMIASNLAHNYAMAGIKTLLIDADMRQAGLTNSFLPDAVAGLQEALTDGFELREAIVRERSSGLHVLPAKGKLAVQSLAAELLSSKRFADGMRSLRNEFEIIVIDSPPLLPVVDARVIADHADQIVYVYNWQRTPRQLAQRAIRSLGINLDRLAGVVVNGVDESKLPKSTDYPGSAIAVDLAA